MGELLHMTGDEWLLVVVATALCIGGLLLRSAGNLLGELFMGEDPAVRRWRVRWAERRAEKRGLRAARKNERRQRKRLRRERALARKLARQSKPPTGSALEPMPSNSE